MVFHGGEQNDGFGNDPGTVAEPAGYHLSECFSGESPILGC